MDKVTEIGRNGGIKTTKDGTDREKVRQNKRRLFEVEAAPFGESESFGPMVVHSGAAIEESFQGIVLNLNTHRS